MYVIASGTLKDHLTSVFFRSRYTSTGIRQVTSENELLARNYCTDLALGASLACTMSRFLTLRPYEI